MDKSINKGVKLNEDKKSNRKKIVTGMLGCLGIISLCVCGLLAYGVYINNTPEGQATATAKAEERLATETEEAAIIKTEATEIAFSTDTPIPTNTLSPTKTPVPTHTLSPTETSIPLSTNTPNPTFTSEPIAVIEPTNTLAPTETPILVETVLGIGVARSDFISVFANTEIDFTFEESSLVDGQPRIMGTSPNELAFLELIGPPDDLIQANILTGVPNDNEQELIVNFVYMLGFLNIAMPDWPDRSDWLTENIETVINEGEISTTYEGRIVTFQLLSEIGIVKVQMKMDRVFI